MSQRQLGSQEKVGRQADRQFKTVIKDKVRVEIVRQTVHATDRADGKRVETRGEVVGDGKDGSLQVQSPKPRLSIAPGVPYMALDVECVATAVRPESRQAHPVSRAIAVSRAGRDSYSFRLPCRS